MWSGYARISHAEDEWLGPVLGPKLWVIKRARVPNDLNEEEREANRMCIGTVGTKELQPVGRGSPSWVGDVTLYHGRGSSVRDRESLWSECALQRGQEDQGLHHPNTYKGSHSASAISAFYHYTELYTH
jgi:hypothetical protein